MSAMPSLAPTTNSGCSLVSIDGRTLPLTHVRLTGEAGAGLAQVQVEQRFHNPYAEALTVSYALPLPADAAVVGFEFIIGERRIIGEVDRKASARERFETAVLQGKTAALLEQNRSSLFTQEIGNIPPGETIVALITLECPLVWREGEWQLRFPTVIGPSYLGSQTPDPERVSVAVADAEVGVEVQVELRLTDTVTGAVSSPSHVVQCIDSRVQLPANAHLDRDIVIRWPVAAAEAGVSLQVHRPIEDPHAYGLMTLVPPSVPVAPIPRDLIVLLDTSGSMGGRPLDQARAFIRGLINGLNAQDRLELIAFASSQEVWSSAPRAMDGKARSEALRWLERRRASGSTQMHTAMIAALQPLRNEAQRQVILVSDGLIGFEHQIINAIRHGLPRSSRVHTVGVGSGVNRSLTRPCARAGGGLEIVVGLDEAVEADVERLLARTGQPQIVDLKIEGDALLGMAPARLPDLFSDAPSPISLKLRPTGGRLRVSGRTAEGAWCKDIEVSPIEAGEGQRSLATRFARETVEDLEIAHAAGEPEIDAQIEAIGVQYQIATRLTSWVAMTDEATVDPADPTRREEMPQNLPYGMSAEGVGLRPVMHPAPTSEALPAATAFWAPMPAAPVPSGPKKTRAKRGPPPAKKRSVPTLSELARKGQDLLFGGRSGGPPQGADMDDEALVLAEEMEAPMPAPPAVQAPGGSKASARILARVIRFADGVLIVEFTVQVDTDWHAATVVGRWASGRSAPLMLTSPSTRAGRVTAGATIRLALDLAEGSPLPSTLDVTGPHGTLTLELDAR